MNITKLRTFAVISTCIPTPAGITVWPWPFDLICLARLAAAVDDAFTKFGVDSSRRFSFRAQTVVHTDPHTQTESHTPLITLYSVFSVYREANGAFTHTLGWDGMGCAGISMCERLHWNTSSYQRSPSHASATCVWMHHNTEPSLSANSVRRPR